ncbi:hypothetical protein [Bifidobacterium sp. ESL0745]|uniref:hypothetical protein n=1 Tax=Bifidobacterium sp. ESL0745 TaxID=2983226 RepID=UPI0023F6481E|nr:hypothetical protein [Bifidobacterium sp. ESL0745]MDF7664517.1 hypothetical protein [Bifidobacterium sp. ESL0745]
MKNLHSPAGSVSALLRPSDNDSLLRMILEYAVKGPMLGALTLAVVELFIPGWIPIGRTSMAAMLIIDVILGELALALFCTDLPWMIIIPLHGISTLLLTALWVFISGGKKCLISKEMLVFVILFIVLYICAWLVISAYSRSLTEGMNKRLDAALTAFKNRNFMDALNGITLNDDDTIADNDNAGGNPERDANGKDATDTQD